MTMLLETPSDATFFRRVLKKCLKSTMGILVVAISVPAIFIGRTGLTRLAAAHQVKLPLATPTSVKTLQLQAVPRGRHRSMSAAGQRSRGEGP